MKYLLIILIFSGCVEAAPPPTVKRIKLKVDSFVYYGEQVLRMQDSSARYDSLYTMYGLPQYFHLNNYYIDSQSYYFDRMQQYH